MSKELLCYCFEISKEEIISIIHKHKTQTVEDIQKHCQAAMGCGSCRFDLEALLEEEKQKMVKI